MKTVRAWLIGILVVLVVAGGFWAWWNLDLRWRPHTVKTRQAEIARILEGSGWVSPRLPGPKLYVVVYRACPDCIQFEQTELARLQAAGVDTRVIAIARADQNGQALSTPAERTTVAELWVNRDWKLLGRWLAMTPPGAWTAPGLPPADGDVARTAVIEAGRKAVADLTPLLKASGVRFAYPVLIWWTKAGVMRGCVCGQPQTWRSVERDLGA
ncbi:MAG TPA: hypothetical protein VFC47_07890 [Caulobacteraceae bacterium]|nr:hypothetical protein [Caulobacteraceae bacterium]